MQAPENTNPERQNNRGPIEKIILIETCRECKSHRSSTWHDETKYENNFKLVQTAINTLTPGVEVIRKMDGPINLGAFEIKHGDQLIYSKKNTGLWPNPKAVAQRVKSYFEDLEAGKNVSNYGKQKEVAYVPKRVPGEVRASTSAGFRTNKLDAKSNTQASAKNLTPSKQTKIDSAGGSPDEGNLEGDHEDKVKHDEEEQHHHHHHEQKPQTPEHQHHTEGSDREAHHEGGPTHHEEHKEEQNKPQSGQATPKEKHDAPAPTHSHENKAHEEHKEPGSAQTKEEPHSAAKGSEPHSAAKGSEPQSAAKSNEPHSAALGSEPQSAGAQGHEPQSAGAKGSEPQSAAKSNEPNSATVSTPKVNKDEKKGEEYPEDFS